ncbi:MAG: hypothetical protein V4550_21185 [Gemmatimonadota bacterium]
MIERYLATPLFCVFALTVQAQETRGVSGPMSDSAANRCSYQTCALGIVPVWNGLAVVEGVMQTPRANLNFFLPRSLGATFRGDSALSYSTRAVQTRMIAAAFTDVGVAIAVVVAAHGLHTRRLTTADRLLAVGGVASLAASVPLQFSADGLLSRAVWWHNAGTTR